MVHEETPSALSTSGARDSVPPVLPSIGIQSDVSTHAHTPPETSGVHSTPTTLSTDNGGWQEVRRKRCGPGTRSGRDTPPHMGERDAEQRALSPSSESTESHGEGTSNLQTFRKGKAVDPTNWGAAGIDPNELDPEAQRREFEKYAPSRTNSPETAPPDDSWRARESTVPIPDSSDDEAADQEKSKGKARNVPAPGLSEQAVSEMGSVADAARLQEIRDQIEHLQRQLSEVQLRSQAGSDKENVPAAPGPVVKQESSDGGPSSSSSDSSTDTESTTTWDEDSRRRARRPAPYAESHSSSPTSVAQPREGISHVSRYNSPANILVDSTMRLQRATWDRPSRT